MRGHGPIPEMNKTCSVASLPALEGRWAISPRPRLEAITTLRFFAALHVVLFHLRVVRILDGGPWWYQNFAGIGYAGVNIFFRAFRVRSHIYL